MKLIKKQIHFKMTKALASKKIKDNLISSFDKIITQYVF
jgi:hypothetical protein